MRWKILKILLLGSGGREHAMAVKLSENKNISRIYVSPGNAGTDMMDICENIPMMTFEQYAQFAKQNNVGLTVAGSEEYLVNGIADVFEKNGLRFFGPNSKAAMLEGSKDYAKQFMKKYGVKTADYSAFTDSSHACEYLDTITKFPIVIKADGLAFGKGVVICEDLESAKKTVVDMLDNAIFKQAGQKIVIETFLQGVEVSVLSFCDGKTILPLLSAKDYKRAYDDDKGENTGGMGSISPNPAYTNEVEQKFISDIMNPTLKGIIQEQLDFMGVIFFGLMVCDDGVYLLEYNVRLGDPETQSVLQLMESDLLDLIDSALNKNLENFVVKWRKKHCICVTMVSGGYPLEYKKGFEIGGLEKLDTKYLVAGADFKDGKVVTCGGRVLNIISLADSAKEAKEHVYKQAQKVDFENMYYRKDIGK